RCATSWRTASGCAPSSRATGASSPPRTRRRRSAKGTSRWPRCAPTASTRASAACCSGRTWSWWRARAGRSAWARRSRSYPADHCTTQAGVRTATPASPQCRSGRPQRTPTPCGESTPLGVRQTLQVPAHLHAWPVGSNVDLVEVAVVVVVLHGTDMFEGIDVLAEGGVLSVAHALRDPLVVPREVAARAVG